MSGIDYESLMNEALRLEQKGERPAAEILYRIVARSESKQASAAERCLQRVNDQGSHAVTVEPKVDKPVPAREPSSQSSGLGGLAALAIIVFAVIAGVGKAGKRVGGVALRGIDGLPRQVVQPLDHLPGARPNLTDSLRNAGGSRLDSPDLLHGLSPPKTDQATEALPRSAADAASAGKPVLRGPASPTGIKVKEIDAKGLAGDAAGIVEHSAAQQKIADEYVLQLIETEGITLRYVCDPCREVYSGKSGEELDEVENDSVTQTVTSVGPLIADIKNETGELSDEKLGEYSRVRVWFADGRPILSMNWHIVYSDEGAGIDFQNHYDLELIEGTEEDFRKGKSVVCRYTDKSLQQLVQDTVRQAKNASGPQLQKSLDDDPITAHLADRLHCDATCDEIHNARITASPSAVIIEDEGRFVVTVRFAFPKR